MQCVILSGGKGTRMKPITNTIPKSLIEINGKSFIDYQLSLLYSQGISDIVICCGYLSKMIINHVGNGNKWNLNVQYCIEDEKNLKGTGGAIKLAFDEKKLQEKFFIIYGDSYLPISFKEIYNFYYLENFNPVMTILKNNNCFDKSNVKKLFCNKIFYDKNCNSSKDNFSYIDYGLSILDRDIISNNIPSDTNFDLSDLFYKLSLQEKLLGYEVYNRFFEIGSFNGLNDFRDFINARQINNS